MNSNKLENQTQNETQVKERAGFITNVMPVLGKTGEYVYFFLPGEITITEHANRFKGLLGVDYTPKVKSEEKREYQPRLGLHAKVRIGLSRDGQWLTVYLPGTLGKISHHVNAYFHIFGLPYEKKPKAA